MNTLWIISHGMMIEVKDPKEAKILQGYRGTKSHFKRLMIGEYEENKIFCMKTALQTYITRTSEW